MMDLEAPNDSLVVYFDQCLGALNSKCWSKYAFQHFLCKKAKKAKKGKKKKFVGPYLVSVPLREWNTLSLDFRATLLMGLSIRASNFAEVVSSIFM
jgi:hypothetical protein